MTLRANSRPGAGFTLIEIVVSLAMLTLVVSALASAHVTIHDAQAKFRGSIHAYYKLQSVQTRHHLGHSVSNSVPATAQEWGVAVEPLELVSGDDTSVMLRVRLGRGTPLSQDAEGYLTLPPNE